MSEYDENGFDKYGQHRIHVAAGEGDLKAVQAELDKGVDVDLATKRSLSTPLRYAAEGNQTEVMKLLLSRGANVDKADSSGNTPLILASYHGYEVAVKLLLEHKANTTLKDKKGKTALDSAKDRNQDKVIALLEAHAKSLNKPASAQPVKPVPQPSVSPAPVSLSVSTPPAIKPANSKLDELTALFTKLDLSEYVAAFAKEKMFVSDFAELEESDIEKLIPEMGPRKKFKKYLASLKSSPAVPSLDAGDSKAVLPSSSAGESPLEELKADDGQYEKAELAFLKSIANTYPRLKFEVTAVARVKPSVSAPALAKYEAIKKSIANAAGVNEEDVKDRWVFHTAGSPDAIPLICASTLRPSGCAQCKSGKNCGDAGWFGDHTKGVYVSKHSDYTFYYQRKNEAQRGDTGSVIMFKMFTGRRKYFAETQMKVAPTAGYHCHESPKHLEFYIWNTDQVVPMFVVRWRAIENERADKLHDGS